MFLLLILVYYCTPTDSCSFTNNSILQHFTATHRKPQIAIYCNISQYIAIDCNICVRFVTMVHADRALNFIVTKSSLRMPIVTHAIRACERDPTEAKEAHA